MNNSIATSEVVDDGEYQIVNFPEGFQFDAEEVLVQKIGNAVFLFPLNQVPTPINIKLQGDKL